MERFYIGAEYYGEENVFGYAYGQKYTLLVQTGLMGAIKVTAQNMHGKLNPESRKQYNSLRLFLRDWRIMAVEAPVIV